jgi:hypothetical protein
MNCAEVMEWMHRYLDHDLSQDEMIEMFRHIDSCSTCAEVFDRLSTLSKSLEQMPDVKPPFSLVDSILPKLDELDQGLHQQSTVKAEDHQQVEQVVVPFSRKVSHQKPVKGNSMARRTGIGAAAAAVILVIAMFNMPEKMPGADVERLMNKSAANTATSNDTAGEISSEAQEQKVATGNAEGNGNASNGGEANSFSAMDVTAQDGGGTAAPSQDVVPSATPGTVQDDSPALAPTKTKEPVKTEKPRKNNRASSQPPKATAPAGQSGGQNSVQNNTDNQGGISASPEVSAQDSDQLPGDAADAGAMGIQSPNSSDIAAAWPSTDGLHAAELVGQQLVIYTLPASGDRQTLTSLPLEGTWVSGEWSSDGTQFTYVTSQQGTNVTKTFTLPVAGTPVASPSVSPTTLPSATPAGTSPTN